MNKSNLWKYVLGCMLLMTCTVSPPASAGQAPAPQEDIPQEVQPGPDAAKTPSVEFGKEYFKGYVVDFGTIITSPVRWDASDWTTAAIITGVAVGLYENDAKIMKWIQDRKTTTTNNIGDAVTDFGHGKYTPAIIGGMYLYGYAADDGKARKTALLSVESFVLTGVFVQTLKYATHRHRPNTGDPYHTWDGASLKGASASSSFPSGHASSAFAVATVIASEYDNAVVPPLAYSIATITALNRAMHNAHWPSDTFVGAAIGYFTGKAIVASHRGGDNRLSLAPMIEGKDVVMALTYKF